MIADPITEMIRELLADLEELGWPTPLQYARTLGIRVMDGPVASLNLGPPPVVQLPINLHGFRRRYTLAHEAAHAIMAWRGIDAELLAYYAPECAHSNMEALANHIASIITIPPPTFREAVDRYGFSPRTMTYLAELTGAPLEVAMDRVIYESDSYRRAAMLFKRGILIDFASTVWLEAELFDAIPDPADRFPGIRLETVERDKGLVLGVWGQ